ncbi:DUF3027 domain-containing protein [Subtercola lobariae]|uniref:DUF3027 domain-containing protein n=1 Tax=Subtercola lobariae TaxID=1588641 RepID=A0A917B386_9MICO|nr:DUF3027 domain-containing protein [Subtercola lobariae]GGF18658.1 hypothetical protein GCM10011399_10380 [Subtercola lobariae]
MSDENTGERPADSAAPAEHSVANHVVAAHLVAEIIAVEAVTDDVDAVEVAGEPDSAPAADIDVVADIDVPGDADVADAYVADDADVADGADMVDGADVADETNVPGDADVADDGEVAGDAEVELTEVVEADGSIAEIVYEADPVLLAAVDQARAALAEITPATSIGELIGHVVEGEHVLSLHFASTLSGYPDWHWAATVARTADDAAPTVLEVELLPGEGAILSPAWVPWADRVTPESLIDDSENEFADDDDDSADEADGRAGGDDSEDEDYDSADSSADDDDDDDDDDDSDDDDDDDSDDDDDDSDDDELDAEEVAARALRRDRDGIDIDTIAEEGLDIDGLDAGELDHLRLIDDIDDAIELTEEALATEDGSDEDPHGPEIDRTY